MNEAQATAREARDVLRMNTGGKANREDSPRNVERVLIDIDCASSSHVICGRKVVRGMNRVEVYVDDVPRIKSLVRNDQQKAALAAAEKVYQISLDRYIKGRLASGESLESITPQRREQIERKNHGDPDGVKFGEILSNHGMQTGVPPFLSAKVVGDHYEAPATPENRVETANRALASAITDAIRAGREPGNNRGRGKG